jgi:ubiquinol-cytochrome c reductase cytochrome c1 subunit
VPALAQEAETPKPPVVNWSFAGPFGTYDKAQLQRGFQVYNEVCSSCHSMKLLSYRDLEGIGLDHAQVKAIASTKTVPGEPNSDGQPTTRPALPSDRFASPFPNDQAARAANNGALPPDQSDLEKARPDGSDYIHALMIGYVTPPADVKVPDGLYYNMYFPGGKIHMPPPLSDGAVTYADGTKATVDQMGRDVAAFLTWASNPEMDERKHMGVRWVGFLAALACVTYGVKRKIWADIH